MVLGEYGWLVVTDAVAHSGTVWCAITMLSGTVFATIGLSAKDTSIAGTWASAAFPAGLTIYGGFTDFTLTSGSVIAYRAGANQ
jgi:hypothetical protein